MENLEKPVSPTNADEGRLGEEEARELANMQRAAINADPEMTANTFEDGLFEETTAADYDSALQAIEELKKLSAEEPATEKVLSALARASEVGRFLVMNAISTGWYGAYDFEEKMQKLEDASAKLRALKEKAKQYS